MDFLRDVPPDRIEQSGAIILVCSVIIFIILERLFPYTRGLKIFRKGFWMDLVWYTLFQSYILKIIIFDLIIAPLKNILGLSEQGIISHWPIWVLLLFFLFTHDFYIYWFHRWQHHNRWLWRTHEAHHSVRTVDWLAGSRSHAIEIFINQTIEFLPVFLLLDVQTAAVIVPLKALADAVWGMWIHSNIDAKTGKLQYIINGPEMHQWHHANHEEVFYANYATKFAIFDWIFGTAFLPGLRPLKWPVIKPKAFGLPYAYPQDFFSQSIYAFIRFDFRSLEKAQWFKFLQNFRIMFLRWCMPVKWMKIVENLFIDENNKLYQIDKGDKFCSNCLRRLKHFYKKNNMHWYCEHCNRENTLSMEKFGVA